MATSRKTKSARAQPDNNPTNSPADAATFLKNQHAEIRAILAKGGSDPTDGDALVREIATVWLPHTMLEEEVLYPAARDSGVDTKALEQAQVRRDLAGILLADLLRGAQDEAFFGAKLVVLAQQIAQLMEWEEKPKEGLLALAAAGGVDMKSLLLRLQERSDQNKQDAEANTIEPPEPRSLRTRGFGTARHPQENRDMARQSNMRERDDQGRFMSDEDDRDNGRGGSRNGNRDRDENGRFASGEDRGYSSRSGSGRDDEDYRSYRSGGRDRDENGRFMSDDDRGYSSRPGRGRDDDHDGRGSRSSGRERDEYGRFASEDERGYSSQSNRGRDYNDDDRRGSRGERGQGGRSGDSEGARRGWDEPQGGSQSRSRNDDDYRPSRSQRDDDDYRSGSRGEGHRGWFGDSEGHSEASRRGWEERQGGARSRSSRDDYDDRRGSRGGHGGWSGDPEGHAEAARRGWQHRR